MMLRALLRGRRAEHRAARFLRSCGLRILATNLRAGGGEVDILAQDDRCAVVVEVRERRGGPLAADLSVTRAKEQRLWRCWCALRARFGIPRSVPVRFDLVLLSGRGRPVHLRAALRLPP